MVYLRAWPQEGPCVGVKGGEGHEFGELQGQVSAVRGGGGQGQGQCRAVCCLLPQQYSCSLSTWPASRPLLDPDPTAPCPKTLALAPLSATQGCPHARLELPLRQGKRDPLKLQLACAYGGRCTHAHTGEDAPMCMVACGQPEQAATTRTGCYNPNRLLQPEQ